MEGLYQSTHALNKPSYGQSSEYLLAFRTDTAVQEQVHAAGRELLQRFPTAASLPQQAQLTLAAFQARPEMEPTLLRWLHRIVASQKAFTAELNNYSGFPPHMIYLRVQDHTPFQQFIRQLQVIDQYIRSDDAPPMQFVQRPHLPVAEHIVPEFYQQALSLYAQQDFHASCAIKELVVLRRAHAFDAYQCIQLFHLAA
jgi:hypothetical protein